MDEALEAAAAHLGTGNRSPCPQPVTQSGGHTTKNSISTTHRASGKETSQPLTWKTSEHLEHTSNTPGTHRDHLRVKNISNWRAFPAPTWKTSEGTKTSSPPRDHMEKRHVTHLEHV